MGKYNDVLKTYDFNFNKENTTALLDKINAEIEQINNETLKKIFGCIDITTLNVTDTEKDILELINKINAFEKEYKTYPSFASLCSFPIYANLIKENLNNKNIEVCEVTGFPNPQTFLEVKIAETALAVSDGADEIDTVISVNKIIEKKYDEVGEEIEEIKHACRNAKLKVILESEVLTAEEIYQAALIAMYAGADFIKTSTGKLKTGATPEAAIIICKAIADFYGKTNTRIGFKAAGGIKTWKDAALYYAITEKICGKDWLNKEYFRLGASKLANDILSKIEGKEIQYF